MTTAPPPSKLGDQLRAIVRQRTKPEPRPPAFATPFGNPIPYRHGKHKWRG